MFGFVVPHAASLSEEEKARYHQVYCGVCRSIEQRYGQRCRLTTSYDMTFLALVLGSLYEPQEQVDSQRCPFQPGAPQSFIRSEYTDYAADLSVALGYHKCLDDWRDDHARRAWLAAQALEHPYRVAAQHRPEACAAIEQAMRDIHTLEEQHQRGAMQGVAHEGPSLVVAHEASPLTTAFETPFLDVAANRFGALLGELFVYRHDFWSGDLRRFGARLGKFVYIMDAALDIEEDQKQGNYNPFLSIETDRESMREDLNMLAAAATDSFERLPLERDVHLMRSVLYAGMWQRFESKENTEDHG